MSLDSIVLFGDSITEWGWNVGGIAQRLSNIYVRKLDILNRGLRGYNTKWGLPVFKSQIEELDPSRTRLVGIWYGANDAALSGYPHHVPLDTFKSNISEMVTLLKTKNINAILITPPPIEEAAVEHFLTKVLNPPWKMDRSFDNAKMYAEAVKEVGKTLGVPVVDAWTGIWDAAGRERSALTKFLPDGLHPNSEGHEIVTKLFLEAIAKTWPELTAEKIPDVVPDFAVAAGLA
ncbi:SGNH hydrolase [Exidia glandulosa HHB12029]|uniref:SGNH hydrolase n=1 Tax=Exidia glandulosa HHB12029 TaxID=1314781 RepID=A0A165NSY5_EXIGL|nr:SGNH hydrolase [Exidia glandulosa HHB12029]